MIVARFPIEMLNIKADFLEMCLRSAGSRLDLCEGSGRRGEKCLFV